MTNTPTPPPAGWYAAPDGSAATWWWDGAVWTQPSTQQPSSPRGIAKLATATQILLVVSGVLSAATIAIESFGISAVGGYFNGNLAALDLLTAYDRMTAVAAILNGIVLLATGVLWMIWQYRVAKQVSGLTRRTPGWHAGSWLIPVVSFWFPYQNISDLWQAIGRAKPSWQIAWWLCWVASGIMTQVSTRLAVAAEDLDGFRIAMSTSIVGELLMLVAAPLAWLIVRRITDGVLHRSVFPVPSPAF